MWTEKQNNGKFLHCERYTDPVTGKQKRVSVTTEKNTAATRKAAQKTLIAKIDEAIRLSSKTDCTMGELVDAWISDKEKHVKASTMFEYRSNGENIKTLIGADTLVSKINSRMVKERLAMISGRKTALNYFKMIMTWGYKNDYVNDIGFLCKIDPEPPCRKTKIEDKYLESDELSTFLNGITREPHKSLYTFLALTGMRSAEAFALTADDIDLKSREITINKNFESKIKTVDTPKTESSYRSIYIQDELFPLARQLRQRALENKMVNGCDLIFQKNGNHLQYYTYCEYARKFGVMLIGRPVTLHMFRHTHVSLLAEHGVDLDTISRRLGHDDGSVTKKVYFHVTEKLKENDKERIMHINIL